VKLSKEELPGGVEMPDGVESRRRVYSDHQNVEDIINTAWTTSSLIQRLVTATFDVWFQPSQSVEVGVDRLIAVTGVATNSYEVRVSDLNVAGEENCVGVFYFVIAVPYHLYTR